MNLKSGDTVRHFQFGQGVIESISGIGTSKQAVVKFNSVGKKKLMLQYAKLVKEVDEF
jgi:DNA helicase-2/ATP-dependent DNA helicase PcrA